MCYLFFIYLFIDVEELVLYRISSIQHIVLTKGKHTALSQILSYIFKWNLITYVYEVTFDT